MNGITGSRDVVSPAYTTAQEQKKIKEMNDLLEGKAKKEDEDSSIIGKDTFLQLMIAKLSNQDPLNPTDDTEFLSQLAQFTTLEQMVNMTGAITMQQGFDMVGKYVIAEYNGGYVTGRVDSVIYDSGEISLDVGGAIISMDNVKEVLAEKMQVENGGTDAGADADTKVETDTEADTKVDADTAVDAETDGAIEVVEEPS